MSQTTTPPNAPDHGCSCGRPDCQYDKAWGNPLRETQPAPDAKPNAPEVDVLAVIDRMRLQAMIGRAADSSTDNKELIGQIDEDRAACTAVAALLTREAALAERNDLLSRANIAYSEQVAKLTGRALNSEEREAALVAEREALRLDAGRYQFIRNPSHSTIPAVWISGKGNVHIESEWLTEEFADTAIDKARAEAGQG